ncbi:hypothetical protein GJAV_G00208910 [Gymnothorax javanicus]|nr:hypothetical protein GJAV_G00208910 [Gymnothorax javanicus]
MQRAKKPAGGRRKERGRDRELRKAYPETGIMPQVEVKTPLSRILNKTTPGLQIWRVEKLELAPIPAKMYGRFFEGDCYVILYTRKIGKGFSYDIHYWLGGTASTDEQGAAAIYTSLMDEHLGGVAIQHREAQGHESDAFRGYFKHGIIYRRGGVASAMNQVETNTSYVQRLLQVKGRKQVVAREVEMSWNSFNKGDVFLLDLGNLIIQWNGPNSNRMERLKGMILAKDIRDQERAGRAQVTVVEGDDERSSEEAMKIMRQVLGERRDIKEAVLDPVAEQPQKHSVKLFQISDVQGNLVMQEVGLRPLTQDLLNNKDCFLLDQEGTRIFIWKGRRASKTEKFGSVDKAELYKKAKGYPSYTYVEIENDGSESAVFRQLFQRWTARELNSGPGTHHNPGKIAKVEQVRFDGPSMHARPDLSAQQRMVDDGTGEVQVWRIEDSDLVPVDKKWLGHFYGGDCYLILYQYEISNRVHYILYIWQGLHASTTELAASTYQAQVLDQQYNGELVQVQVPMGKEPMHLLAIFKGKMIVYEVGSSRGEVSKTQPAVRLFHIHGTNEFNTCAIEVPARATCLHSNDVFVLKTENCCYLWYGKGCNGDEREMGKSLADTISRREKRVIAEGQEPADFWLNLGGRSQYPNSKRLQEESLYISPRLFECSNQTGRFIATEITNFTQEDLDEDDVMLLDIWDQVFLWIGKGANEMEKKEAFMRAQEYLRNHPAGRNVEAPLVLVKQEYEPPTFTGWFPGWDTYMWRNRKTYEQLKAELGDARDIVKITLDMTNLSPIREPVTLLQETRGPSVLSTFHPDKLVHRLAEELPEGVDPTRKEEYLSSEDFALILGVSRLEFYAMPDWKQRQLKKDKGLF